MAKQEDPSPAGLRLTRRALLGGLAVATATPWLLHGVSARADAGTVVSYNDPLPRQQHCSVLLGSGSVLVTGGVTADGSVLDDAVIYKANGSLLSIAPMNTARFGHAAVLLPYGKVIVLGGYGQGPLDDAEIYDSISDTWTPAKPLSLPRYNHTAVRVSGSQILVIGGYSEGVVSDTETYSF